MGEVFILGGLAGFPFTGNAGWAQLIDQVPDNGNIFVLYGPHMGVDAEAKFGKVRRPG